MSLANILRRTNKLAVDNSPLLLTAVGVAGVIGTAILTHKATKKAEAILKENDEAIGMYDLERRDRKTTIQLVWKSYIPPVTSGALTIGAIVFANRIGTKRAAALAAAYTISEQAFSEYKEQVIQKIGAQKEQQIRDEMMRHRIEDTPMTEKNVIIMGSGENLCFDQWSGRYFNSSVEEIRAAVNEVNFMVNHNGYASLTDFYDCIGLPRTQESEEVGWTVDKLLEVNFSTHLADDGRPCIGFSFQVHPVRGFHAHG